jgi:hypothetical protein
MLDVDEELRANAWTFFTRYKDQEFSFTNCTSFAVMSALGLCTNRVEVGGKVQRGSERREDRGEER